MAFGRFVQGSVRRRELNPERIQRLLRCRQSSRVLPVLIGESGCRVAKLVGMPFFRVLQRSFKRHKPDLQLVTDARSFGQPRRVFGFLISQTRGCEVLIRDLACLRVFDAGPRVGKMLPQGVTDRELPRALGFEFGVLLGDSLLPGVVLCVNALLGATKGGLGVGQAAFELISHRRDRASLFHQRRFAIREVTRSRLSIGGTVRTGLFQSCNDGVQVLVCSISLPRDLSPAGCCIVKPLLLGGTERCVRTIQLRFKRPANLRGFSEARLEFDLTLSNVCRRRSLGGCAGLRVAQRRFAIGDSLLETPDRCLGCLQFRRKSGFPIGKLLRCSDGVCEPAFTDPRDRRDGLAQPMLRLFARCLMT